MYLLGCRSRLMGREVIEMCGALLWGPVWGFWWIFPVLGFLMCLAMAFRFWRSGAGCMGMGSQRAVGAESHGENRR